MRQLRSCGLGRSVNRGFRLSGRRARRCNTFSTNGLLAVAGRLCRAIVVSIASAFVLVLGACATYWALACEMSIPCFTIIGVW